MNRRNFTKICTSIVIAAGSTPAHVAAAKTKVGYQRSQLQASGSKATLASDLKVGEPYIFFYPYVTTPCLLINLDGTASADSEWLGGVGPNGSIVAYSAICSHKMSHPAREISFINYRHDPINFYSRKDGKTVEKSGLISCCSERSVYDPAQGAKVLGGPAPHPLAAIELEYDESSDQLFATGSYGADMYDRFFEKFGFRAAMEHKISNPKTESGAEVQLQKLTDYSRQTIKC